MLSLLLPVRNESALIESALLTFPRHPDLEILVLDDHSTDDTAARASQRAKVILSPGRGRGAALDAGAAAGVGAGVAGPLGAEAVAAGSALGALGAGAAGGAASATVRVATAGELDTTKGKATILAGAALGAVTGGIGSRLAVSEAVPQVVAKSATGVFSATVGTAVATCAEAADKAAKEGQKISEERGKQLERATNGDEQP